MPPISFQQIPNSIGVPGSYVEFDGSRARTGQPGKPYALCVYGQMDAPKTVPYPNGSTAGANIPVTVSSAAQAAALFGPGSILAHMAESIFKTNSTTPVIFVPQLDAGGGVARVLTANYATPYAVAAAVPGSERLYIGDRVYTVPVAVGNTATNVAAAMLAAINADTGALFVATAVAAVLTLTAKNKGECANDVQVVSQYNTSDASPSGAFVQVTQTTAGSVNPSVSAGIASASTLYMTHVVNPYTDATNYALLLAEAQDRWAPLPNGTSVGNGQDDIIVFGAYRGTEAQFISHMATRNSEFFTTAHIEPGQTINALQYGGLMSSAWQFAAAYAATSAALASVVANNPHQLVALSCIVPAPAACRFPFNVRNRTILVHGGATYTYNPSGQVMLEAAITERTLTDSGAPTDAERRVETQLAKSYLRWSLRAMLEATYPRARLANDGTPGLPNNVATPNLIKGAIVALAKTTWVANGIVEDFAGFKNTLIVERSADDCNTIKFQIFPDLVNVLTIKSGKVSYIVC